MNYDDERYRDKSKRDHAGKPPHEKTEENFKIATSLASYGVPTLQIAAALDISGPTLFKYYKEDMTKARAKANAVIGQTLYQKARSGDTTAMIWWTKAQMGWCQQQPVTPQQEEKRFQIQFVKAISDKPSQSNDEYKDDYDEYDDY